MCAGSVFQIGLIPLDIPPCVITRRTVGAFLGKLFILRFIATPFWIYLIIRIFLVNQKLTMFNSPHCLHHRYGKTLEIPKQKWCNSICWKISCNVSGATWWILPFLISIHVIMGQTERVFFSNFLIRRVNLKMHAQWKPLLQWEERMSVASSAQEKSTASKRVSWENPRTWKWDETMAAITTILWALKLHSEGKRLETTRFFNLHWAI